MKKDIITRHRLFVTDIEKEQAFIDSYREKGYKLVGLSPFTCKYVFKKCDDAFIPHVRIDYRIFNKIEEYQDYVTFFGDAGWKHIGGSKSSGVQYFEQTNADITEELFSDKQSYAELYRRIYRFSMYNLVIWVCLFVATINSYDIRLLLRPKELFLTPGLWDSSGIKFVFGFLFELPFVIWRNGGPFIALIFLIVFIVCAIKAKIKENKYMQKV